MNEHHLSDVGGFSLRMPAHVRFPGTSVFTGGWVLVPCPTMSFSFLSYIIS